MEESVNKAFDFASDVTKQLITLSTGILALTITFAKDIFQSVPRCAVWLLVITWFIYLLSIGLGILTLLALTGTLDPMKTDQTDITVPVAPTIRRGSITFFSHWQIVSFLLGTLMVIVFGTLGAGFDRNIVTKNVHVDRYVLSIEHATP